MSPRFSTGEHPSHVDVPLSIKHGYDVLVMVSVLFLMENIMASIATFIPVISALIDRLFPDKIKQDEAKAELLEVMYKAQAEEYKAKGEIVKAEASGKSWLQRNWRPVAMMVFLAVVVQNYILAPWLGAFGVTLPTVPIASEMWTMLTVGIGGYIVGRSGEKMMDARFNDRKYFESLRTLYGSLSQKDVDKHNKALKSAKE